MLCTGKHCVTHARHIGLFPSMKCSTLESSNTAGSRQIQTRRYSNLFRGHSGMQNAQRWARNVSDISGWEGVQGTANLATSFWRKNVCQLSPGLTQIRRKQSFKQEPHTLFSSSLRKAALTKHINHFLLIRSRVSLFKSDSKLRHHVEETTASLVSVKLMKKRVEDIFWEVG